MTDRVRDYRADEIHAGLKRIGAARRGIHAETLEHASAAVERAAAKAEQIAQDHARRGSSADSDQH